MIMWKGVEVLAGYRVTEITKKEIKMRQKSGEEMRLGPCFTGLQGGKRAARNCTRGSNESSSRSSQELHRFVPPGCGEITQFALDFKGVIACSILLLGCMMLFFLVFWLLSVPYTCLSLRESVVLQLASSFHYLHVPLQSEIPYPIIPPLVICGA